MKKKVKEKGLEYYYYGKDMYSIVLRDNYSNDSIRFFTPNQFSQQLAYLPHKKGNIIKAHIHNLYLRKILYTEETLIVKKGRVKINFYSKKKRYLNSVILGKGDIILICGGGHGFEILEDAVMIEIKQGPYIGVIEKDKEKFDGIE